MTAVAGALAGSVAAATRTSAPPLASGGVMKAMEAASLGAPVTATTTLLLAPSSATARMRCGDARA